MENLNGESKNIVAENIDKIKELFPEVFTGNKIDFGRLQEALGEYVEENDERYRFEWHGKSKAIRLAQTPSTGTLRPYKEESESKNWDTTENLYIEGDNLEVLKLLQKTYNNSVKMIYIDPPYNTGKDFVYKDNFRDNIKNYLEITGQTDDDGKKNSTNSEASGRYHTDWLNMMYPRLRLARNLLTDDGVIFISIDENEISNLTKICDEIFGEENHINTIAVKMSEATGVKMAHVNKRLPKLKEYILIYAKRSRLFIINKISIPKDKWDYEYKHVLKGVTKQELDKVKAFMDKDKVNETEFKEVDYICSKMKLTSLKKLYEEEQITTELDKLKALYSNAWRIVRDVATTGGAKKIADEKKQEIDAPFFLINTPKNKKYLIKSDYSDVSPQPRIKLLFADQYLTVNPGDFWQDIKTTGLDNEGEVSFKNGKKPLKMIERLTQLITTENDIILDFFSGSATTAHAVMNFNAMNNKQLNFVMVQLPEQTDEKSEAYKAGYKNICEIGKERIRLAGDKILEDNINKDGIEDLDVGFKVFKLDSSNLKKWNPDYDNLEISLDNIVENYVEGRTEEDVLYEIMLKFGIDLTYPIEIEEVNGKKIFIIGFGALFVCLSDEITTDIADYIANKNNELEPDVTRVVFKDNGFIDDSAKTNIMQILKRNGIEEIMSV